MSENRPPKYAHFDSKTTFQIKSDPNQKWPKIKSDQKSKVTQNQKWSKNKIDPNSKVTQNQKWPKIKSDPKSNVTKNQNWPKINVTQNQKRPTIKSWCLFLNTIPVQELKKNTIQSTHRCSAYVKLTYLLQSLRLCQQIKFQGGGTYDPFRLSNDDIWFILLIISPISFHLTKLNGIN